MRARCALLLAPLALSAAACAGAPPPEAPRPRRAFSVPAGQPRCTIAREELRLADGEPGTFLHLRAPHDGFELVLPDRGDWRAGCGEGDTVLRALSQRAGVTVTLLARREEGDDPVDPSAYLRGAVARARAEGAVAAFELLDVHGARVAEYRVEGVDERSNDRTSTHHVRAMRVRSDGAVLDLDLALDLGPSQRTPQRLLLLRYVAAHFADPEAVPARAVAPAATP